MSRLRFPLTGVLRVRKVREAAALTDAVQARNRVSAAEDEIAYRERRLQDSPAPGTGPALAVAAALAARRSMAEDTAVARGLAAAAREVSAARTEVLVAARAQRRGVELLKERWTAARAEPVRPLWSAPHGRRLRQRPWSARGAGAMGSSRAPEGGCAGTVCPFAWSPGNARRRRPVRLPRSAPR